MDILSLKRRLWVMPGLRINDGDGEGGRGDSNAGGRSGDSPGGDSGGDGSNPGSGLSAGSPGLGLGTGWGYSSTPSGYGLSSGLTDAYGRDVSPGGTGIRGDGGNSYGIGDGVGNGLTGLAGMNLGLSPSQRAGMLGYIAKQDEPTQNWFTKILNTALKIGVPVYGLIDTISKGVTGKDLVDNVKGWASSVGITADQLASAGPAPESINGDYREGDVDSSWVRGPTSGTGEGEAPAATDPLADIFAEFTGAASNVEYNAPAYNADPSGLVARGGQYADTYDSLYAPYAQKMMTEVDRYGSPEYQSMMRNQSMAGVQQQSDAGLQAAQRNMQRMGVNPASGRMAAMTNQNAIQTAAAKTQAAMNSDASLRDTYNKGLSAINTMGLDVGKMGQGWAALGNDAAKTQNTWGLASSELGLKAATQNQNNAYNWGSLANQKYGIDRGISAKADAALSDNQWTLGTALVGKLVGGLTTPTTPSGGKEWWEE